MHHTTTTIISDTLQLITEFDEQLVDASFIPTEQLEQLVTKAILCLAYIFDVAGPAHFDEYETEYLLSMKGHVEDLQREMMSRDHDM